MITYATCTALLSPLAYIDNGNGTATTGWFCEIDTGETYRYTRCI